MAYDGWRSFDGYADGAVKVCAVIACTSDLLASCGTRFDNTTEIFKRFSFNSIKISTKIKGTGNNLIVPSTLDWSLLPLSPSEFKFDVSSNEDQEVPDDNYPQEQ